METPPHFNDKNGWNPISETEIDRLQKTLHPHLKKMGVLMAPTERTEFVKALLAKQNGTCAFGSKVGGMYCWNEPKDKEKTYLKLQWGHIKPRCRKEATDLFLQCARCNNQIQTSRQLHQLPAELISKAEHISAMNSSVQNS
jgi:hypothetical protein